MASIDVIVVGAGVEGSSTAYTIASRGKKVLLLEQFDALNTRNSSHGPSRITRRAYEKQFYVQMMDEAYNLWDQVEKKADVKIYKRTGILYCGAAENVNPVVQSLTNCGIKHKVFTGAEINKKYTKQLQLPDDNVCVQEDDAGILLAAKAVATFQKLFILEGGILLDNCKVLEIHPGEAVTVSTTKGIFTANRLVITAGAWSPMLLQKLGLKLPFQVIRPEVYYWKVDDPDAFLPEQFPVFIIYATRMNGDQFYGIPSYEYPGFVKICGHFGPSVENPDERDACGVATMQSTIASFVASYFKGVSNVPSVYDGCLYTLTPDNNPVLDRHPLYSNVIIGTGFSGHGFKLSPVVGKILCELTLDLPLSYDLTPFCISRLLDK